MIHYILDFLLSHYYYCRYITWSIYVVSSNICKKKILKKEVFIQYIEFIQLAHQTVVDFLAYDLMLFCK